MTRSAVAMIPVIVASDRVTAEQGILATVGGSNDEKALHTGEFGRSQQEKEEEEVEEREEEEPYRRGIPGRRHGRSKTRLGEDWRTRASRKSRGKGSSAARLPTAAPGVGRSVCAAECRRPACSGGPQVGR